VVEPTLEEKILADIKKTGFPLELRIAHQLLTRGYFVDHNLYYVDKDESKGREIEISALRNSQNPPRDKPPQWVRNRLLIECKKNEKNPWVIFTSVATYYDTYHETIPFTGIHSNKIDADTVAAVTALHPYWLLPRRGRSWYEAFKGADTTGQPNQIFKALMSVARATIASMEENSRVLTLGNVVLYQPVVVLEGNLFEAYLDTGEVKLNRPKWIPVAFTYQSSQYKSRRLPIVVLEESHLNEFLQALDEALAAWAFLFDTRPDLVILTSA
jgi:hypothetical protein